MSNCFSSLRDHLTPQFSNTIVHGTQSPSPKDFPFKWHEKKWGFQQHKSNSFLKNVHFSAHKLAFICASQKCQFQHKIDGFPIELWLNSSNIYKWVGCLLLLLSARINVQFVLFVVVFEANTIYNGYSLAPLMSTSKQQLFITRLMPDN